MQKRKTALTFLLVLASLLCVAVLLLAFLRSNTFDFDAVGSSYLDLNGWKRLDTGEEVTLPFTFEPDLEEVYLQASLPSHPYPDFSIYLSTNYQLVDLAVGDRVLMDSRTNHSMTTTNDQWVMADLIPSDAGQTITVGLLGRGSKNKIEFYQALAGSKLAIRFALTAESLLSQIITLILITLSLTLAIASMFENQNLQKRKRGFLPLSFFILFCAVWIFEDSSGPAVWFIQSELHLMLNIFNYLLFPIPLLFYIRDSYSMDSKLLNAGILTFLLNFVVNCVFLLCHTYRLSISLSISHFLVSILIVFLFSSCLTNLRKKHDPDLYWLMGGIIIFAGSGIAQLSFFYFSEGADSNITFFSVGIFSFILILFINSVQKILWSIRATKDFSELTYVVPCGICRIENNDALTITYANRFFYSIFGYTEEEALKAGFSNFCFNMFPKDVPGFKAELAAAVDKGRSFLQAEHRFFMKDGGIIWIQSRFYRDPHSPQGGFTCACFNVDNRKKMEEQQKVREEEYRIATEHSNKMIMRYHLGLNKVYIQQNACDLFGLPSEMNNIPMSILDTGIVSNESKDKFLSFFQNIVTGKRSGNCQVSLKVKKDGEFLWYQFNFTTVFDSDGYPSQAIISFYDINNLHEKEVAFERWQQTFDKIPKERMSNYGFNLSDNAVENIEGELFPVPPAEIVNDGISCVVHFISDNFIFQEDQKIFLHFLNAQRIQVNFYHSKKEDSIVFRRKGTEGQPLWTLAEIQVIPDPFSTGIKCYVRIQDIDEEKQKEITLMRKSNFDYLTGLLRRETFLEQFSSSIKTYGPEAHHVLCIIDIDNFKNFNDTLGHQAGDEVIRAVATRIKADLREYDICGRLGGDEFVVCLLNTKSDEGPGKRFDNLLDSVRFTWQNLNVTCSMGASIYPEDGQTFDELYQKADIALYKVKAHGKNNFELYSPEEREN